MGKVSNKDTADNTDVLLPQEIPNRTNNKDSIRLITTSNSISTKRTIKLLGQEEE